MKIVEEMPESGIFIAIYESKNNIWTINYKYTEGILEYEVSLTHYIPVTDISDVHITYGEDVTVKYIVKD